MTNKEKIVDEMLAIQNAVNCNVDLDWKSKNREWYRAAWIECAELVDSLDWKWWKHQEADINNAKIEAIDIWHFILAKCIESNVCSNIIVAHWQNKSQEDFIVTAERLAFNLLKTRFEGASIVSVIEPFSKVCSHLELSIEDVYVYYIGKATLNKFRQNNGYKEGNYIKEWTVKNYTGQDNEFLTEILQQYLGNQELPDNLQGSIYSELNNIYKNII